MADWAEDRMIHRQAMLVVRNHQFKIINQDISVATFTNGTKNATTEIMQEI